MVAIKQLLVVAFGLLLFVATAASADTAVEDASVNFDGDGNACTFKVDSTNDWAEQSFTVDNGECFDRVEWSYYEAAGSPGGDVCVRIETDSAGDPSGTLVASHAQNCSAASVGGVLGNTQNFTFSSEICDGAEITDGTKYHVVVNATYASVDGANNWRHAGSKNDNYRSTTYTQQYSTDGGSSWGNACGTNVADWGFVLWDVAGGGGGGGTNNSVTFGASNPADGLNTLIATRNYTFTPIENATVNIDSCSLYSNASNASVPIATRNNPKNNTEDGFLMTLPSAQTHNYQMICQNNDSSNAQTGNRSYTYEDFSFTSESHDSTEYETVSTAYSYQFDVGEGVASVSVPYLSVNGTLYSLAAAGTVNITISGSRQPALVAVNDTQYGHTYIFTLNFDNGTSYNMTSPATYYQNVWWAYWQNLSASPLNVLEGETFTATTTLTNQSSAATVIVQQFYNGTTQTPSWSAAGYLGTFTAPAIGNNYYPEDVESNLTVSFGATTINRTSPQTENVTVWKAQLATCGGISSEVAINFTFWEEEDVYQPLHAVLEATYWGFPNPSVNHTYSHNCTNVTYCEVCIFPAWANFSVDSFQNYYSPAAYYTTGEYDLRAYFLEGAEVSNTTSNISLYMENNTLAKLVPVSLDDTDGQGVEDALIYFARYYPGEDAYRTVAMIRTDDYGQGNTYLRPNDIWYRVTVARGGEVLSVFSPQTISCAPSADSCPLSLTLAPSEYLEFIQYWDEVAYYCSFNATGLNATSCSITDTSGLMQYARLQVWQVGHFANTEICDINITTSSGTLSCNLGNVSGVYSYVLSAHFQSEIELESGTIEYGAAALFGAEGLFLALAIFLVCAMVGAFNPAVSVLLGFVGIVVAFALGLFSIEWSAVVAIGVVAVVLMLRMRGS